MFNCCIQTLAFVV